MLVTSGLCRSVPVCAGQVTHAVKSRLRVASGGSRWPLGQPASQRTPVTTVTSVGSCAASESRLCSLLGVTGRPLRLADWPFPRMRVARRKSAPRGPSLVVFRVRVGVVGVGDLVARVGFGDDVAPVVDVVVAGRAGQAPSWSLPRRRRALRSRSRTAPEASPARPSPARRPRPH